MTMRATPLSAPATKSTVRRCRLAFVSLLTLITQAGDYTYTVDEGAITITRYHGSGGAVSVPATIGSLPVTRIGPSAFAYRSEVTGVTIPAEVGSIEHSAFRGCNNLTDLTLPTGLTNIGAYAFSQCTRLGQVTIPAGIQQVGDGAFQNCASLDTVDVSEGISRLGHYAFHGCRRLSHVSIPASLREIGIGAFAACSSLIGIQVAALNPNYRSDDGILFDQARDVLQQYPGGRTGDYAVPPGVSGIRAVAFQGCAGLTSLTIPASVTAIGSGAFDACTNLLSIAVDPRNASYQSAEGVLFASDRTELVRYPPGKAGIYAVPGIVTTIGDSAFADAIHLEQVTLPDSVRALGVAVFAGCRQLRGIVLSTAITNIPGSTFSSCTSLGEVVIHGGVISLDDFAFSDCSALTNVALSAGLRAIGGMTFAGCAQLSDIALPDGLTSLGDGAFLGCSSLRGLTIPDGLISLGGNAFESCEQLTRVRLPASLGRIEYGTFAWCSSLTNVDIPEGVAALESYAFYACTSLRALTLPASLARIGDGAFDSCASLEVLDCRGNPPTPGADMFQGADRVIVYYRSGTRGWETTFGGRPTALWGAPPPIVSGLTVFPIATNDGVVNVGGIGACDGTNFLAAYVSGNSYHAQVIRPDGTGQGPPIWLGENPAFTPTVVATYGAGSYLVLWTDGSIGSGDRIFGQRIAPTGLTTGGPFPLLASSGSHGPQRVWAVAFDGHEFLVVWQDGADGFLYGQWLTVAGTLDGGEFVISDQPDNGQSAAVAGGAGKCLVVWQSDDGPPDSHEWTYGALVSRAGGVGSRVRLSETPSIDQNPLAVAFDGVNFFVVWNQDSELTPSGGAIWNLYGRLVSSSGAVAGPERLISTNQPLFPSLAFDGDNYVLGWSVGADAGNADHTVRLRFFDRTATPLGPEVTPFTPRQGRAPLMLAIVAGPNQLALASTFCDLRLSPEGEFEGFASGLVYGAFLPRSAAAPGLSIGSPQVAGQCPLRLTGTPGIRYAIEFASSLNSATWSALVTNSPLDGVYQFTDLQATDPMRCYRAVTRP